MKTKSLLKTLIVLFFALIGFVYAGIGYSVAWILDIGLNVDVNYSVFVGAGILIYVICLLIVAMFGVASKRLDEKLEEMKWMDGS